jgi:hypothetical protein
VRRSSHTVTLSYSLKPHQLTKLFNGVAVVDNDDDDDDDDNNNNDYDDASNYETTT